MTVLELECTLV